MLLRGCAQSVLDPGINDAAIRLLTRKGVEVVLAEGEGCCGALVHHMGRAEDAHRQVKRNVDAWTRVIEDGGLDAIVVTTSGCGTTVKDYGFILRNDPAYADKAAAVSALAKDITEYLDVLGLGEPAEASGLTVAYHAACSLQHGQQVTVAPKALLARAGFVIREPAESHICCGSAGTYNLLQPEIAGQLRDRKVGNIEATAPQLVAAGNIGCITQIGSGTDLPVVHTSNCSTGPMAARARKNSPACDSATRPNQGADMPPITMTPLPEDLPAAIRETKARLRDQIGDVAAVLADVEDAMRGKVAAIVAAREAGQVVFPVVALCRHRRRHRAGGHGRGDPGAGLRGGQGDLRARRGRAMGPRHRRLSGGQPFRRDLSRPGRPGVRRPRLEQAADLPDLLVEAADQGAAG